MFAEIFSYIAKICTQLILFLGYPGLFILMAMESMVFPLPSELVMPFAGYLIATGHLSWVGVIVASSLGSLCGSLISYYIGKHGGERTVRKFGKYLLLDVADLEKTEGWFRKSGSKTIFISRFVPVVRHLISIPAGIGKMDLKKFSIYTVLGATIWNTFLAYLGYWLGSNWQLVRQYSEYLSIVVVVLLVIAAVYFVYRHVKHKRTVSSLR